MSNPFILDVHDILRQQGAPEHIQTSGESPLHLGGEMFGIAKGSTVTVDVLLTNLGEAIMVDGTITGTADGECARCLRDFHNPLEVKVHQVFGTSPDFITSDSSEDDEDVDEPPVVVDDKIDLTQTIVDEAGLNAPFSPTCDNFRMECEDSTPEPDGISEEVEAEEKVDPRWAGLEKFKNLAEGSDADNRGGEA